MKIDNENTFKKCLGSGINLFLGSGFSVEATGMFDGEEKSMPAGDGLRQEILKIFGRDPNSKMSLAQLCQIISATSRDELNQFLKERFTVVDFDNIYTNIERANIKAIFTTNIDDLVFKIFSESQKYYVNDIALRGPSITGASAIDYIALHGSVIHPDSEGMDFSPVEISSSFERDKDKWYGYLGRIQQTPTLYWGYSMADAGVLQALAKESSNGRAHAPAWVTVRSEDTEAIEYYSSLGFHIIVADTAKLLKYFGQLKVQKSSGKSKRLLNKMFSEYFIPSIDKVPVRSLKEFYLGAEPSWYDVFRGQLHQTDHFSKAMNCIEGGKNCLLIGGAITGKTTLLKLLANGSNSDYQPIFINEITKEKAKLLVKDIDAEGVKIKAYIDNVADAWEAIKVLSTSENIQIIAAERDYIFDSVAHRFPQKQFEIFDVSGLSLFDIQAVKDLIPSGIQRKAAKKFKDTFEEDLNPTFYEVLDSHIAGHFLTDRFMEALKDLKRETSAKYDLLLLSCYLYSCRIPTSVDVAAAYIRDKETEANKVYDLLTSMTSLLSPYEGTLSDSNQAYFVPRSRAVAEAVIRRINHRELRHLLTKFHSEVSTSKIPRYDIFKRMAYDANFSKRAFQKWDDGLAFYESCFYRDPIHSLKQQGAIYLLRHKQYPLAFKWIDEAMAMAGKRGASVKNTYAVILFNANYDKISSDPSIVTTLDESMKILQQCYTEDLRKVYHAKVFADQAIKYAEIFMESSNAEEYLHKAIQWLRAELKMRVGDRSINQLLRKLNSTLRRIR